LEDEINSAFIFIKPHANTPATRELVQLALGGNGFVICQEGEIYSKEIDQNLLIDQHYYAIASKATLLKPKEMPVPAEKFEEFFGIPWSKVLDENLAFNAKDACEHLGVDAKGLDAIWRDSKKVKLGGGFYCGEIVVPEKPTIYVFNGFFMTLRSKFVEPKASIHYYTVEFSPKKMTWSDFRGNFLGSTDPTTAPSDSLRGKIYSQWESLGLEYVPNVGDNGVHASASPFEGLAEKTNWLRVSAADDKFGARLIKAGISAETIKKWSQDPQVDGKSLFDSLEDLDCNACIRKCVELASTI
jgi:hypothetical protein